MEQAEDCAVLQLRDDDHDSLPHCTRSIILTVWIKRSVLEVWIRKGARTSRRQSGSGHPRHHWLGTGLGMDSFQPFRPVTGQGHVHADTEDIPPVMFHL